MLAQRQVEITDAHVRVQVGEAAAQRDITLTASDATIRVGSTVSVVVTETGIVITGGAVTVTGSAVTVSGSSVAVTGTTTVNGVAVCQCSGGHAIGGWAGASYTWIDGSVRWNWKELSTTLTAWAHYPHAHIRLAQQ